MIEELFERIKMFKKKILRLETGKKILFFFKETVSFPYGGTICCKVSNIPKSASLVKIKRSLPLAPDEILAEVPVKGKSEVYVDVPAPSKTIWVSLYSPKYELYAEADGYTSNRVDLNFYKKEEKASPKLLIFIALAVFLITIFYKTAKRRRF